LRGGDIQIAHATILDHVAGMSWALNEFFAAVEEEFGVPVGDADDSLLDTPGAVIDFVVENSEPTDGMTDEEHRDHVAGVVGEIMARTLGVTRYAEDSRFIQDLHVR
jgi:acyl carrier protein